MAVADLVSPAALAAANALLTRMTAEERVGWALAEFPGSVVVSTSFGAQAAVMLSLATRVWADIPVVLVDTGYLFPETYQFADQLCERLKLNLKVYSAPISPAWQEARHGRRWEQGAAGLADYNQVAKVEPMQRALRELGATAWLAGLRRSQSAGREQLPVVAIQDGRVKVLPIIDWTDRDVHYYLNAHGLPYHPLWEQGYVSIGDIHTTRPLTAELTAEQTRFFGLKRECGLHEATDGGLI